MAPGRGRRLSAGGASGRGGHGAQDGDVKEGDEASEDAGGESESYLAALCTGRTTTIAGQQHLTQFLLGERRQRRRGYVTRCCGSTVGGVH